MLPFSLLVFHLWASKAKQQRAAQQSQRNPTASVAKADLKVKCVKFEGLLLRYVCSYIYIQLCSKCGKPTSYRNTLLSILLIFMGSMLSPCYHKNPELKTAQLNGFFFKNYCLSKTKYRITLTVNSLCFKIRVYFGDFEVTYNLKLLNFILI